MSQIYLHSRSVVFTIHNVVCLMDKLADDSLHKNLQVTYSQFLILMALGENPHICQVEIAHILRLTQPAISRQIETLEKKKFIVKNQNKGNRREYILSLTTLGNKKLHQALHVLDSTFDEVFKSLNKNEKKILSQSLDKLLNSLCNKKHL